MTQQSTEQIQRDTDTDGFFDDAVSSGAPSIKLSDVNDGVLGEIVDQFKVPKKKFASEDVETDRVTGKPIMQLVVIVQTNLTNWDRVSKIPKVDYSDKNSPDRPGSEDDGKRAIYIPPYTNIHAAVGKATAATNGGRPCGLRNGGQFGLKVEALEDVGKGNPKRVFAAMYRPPVAPAESEGFFGAQNAQGGPNDAAAQPAAPVQADPFAQASQPAPSAPAPQPQAPAQPAAPAQQQDPWAAPAPAAQPGDPFAGQAPAGQQQGPPF